MVSVFTSAKLWTVFSSHEHFGPDCFHALSVHCRVLKRHRMLAELRVQSRTQHKHSEQGPDLLRPDLMLPESVSLLEQVLLLYDFLEPAVTVAISANSLRADLETPRMGRAGPVTVPVGTLSVLYDEAAAWG